MNIRDTLDYTLLAGIVPGGMYAGITQIPGDVNGEWVKGDSDSMESACPACKEGVLFDYWQGQYYKTKCESCGYLHDTGMKLTDQEAEIIHRIGTSESIIATDVVC